MKLKQGKLLWIVAAAVPFIIVLLGAALQTTTLLHAQKMGRAQRQQIVYIQASKVAQLLNEAGSGMGAYSMTRMPLYAERFNKANEAIPKAMEELGNLGPFEGTEAEAVSQLKQAASESMALLAQAQAAMVNPEGNPAARHQGFALYRAMKQLGERIQGSVQRLTPEGGTSAFLQQEKDTENETGFLRVLTIVWLVNSLLVTAGLIFIIKQSSLAGSS